MNRSRLNSLSLSSLFALFLLTGMGTLECQADDEEIKVFDGPSKMEGCHPKESIIGKAAENLKTDLNAVIDLYIKPDAAVAATDYTVNLMWIGKAKDTDQQYLSPGNEIANLIKHISAWSAASPGGNLNLWYDSAMTTPDAVAATQSLLSTHVASHPDWAKVNFKDVRDLPEVKDNPQAFTEEVPVYFRVDLLRAIAAYNTLKPGKRNYFLYSDLDVKPLSKEEIFDKKTLHKMNQYGVVMADGGNNGYENSFQMFSNHKPNLLKAIKEAIINPSLKTAEKYIAETLPIAQKSTFDQHVYTTYPAMFSYYYHLEGWGTAQIGSEPLKSAKDLENVHPIEVHLKDPKANAIRNKTKYDPRGKEENAEKFKIPTKIIAAPPSQFGGRPTQFNPNFINPRTFSKKLEESLNNKGNFNNTLLFLAAQNNYTKDLHTIVDTLTPEELTKACTTNLQSYSKENPLVALIREGHNEILQEIFKKLGPHPELIDQVAQNLKSPRGNYDIEIKNIETVNILMGSLSGSKNYERILPNLEKKRVELLKSKLSEKSSKQQ